MQPVRLHFAPSPTSGGGSQPQASSPLALGFDLLLVGQHVGVNQPRQVTAVAGRVLVQLIGVGYA